MPKPGLHQGRNSRVWRIVGTEICNRPRVVYAAFVPRAVGVLHVRPSDIAVWLSMVSEHHNLCHKLHSIETVFISAVRSLIIAACSKFNLVLTMCTREFSHLTRDKHVICSYTSIPYRYATFKSTCGWEEFYVVNMESAFFGSVADLQLSLTATQLKAPASAPKRF
jgi:hypothetical protein